MNLLKHFTYPAAAALLLATAACTKDELADGDRLPEGQYPLEIARITLGVEGGEAQPWGTPQTRVSEIADGTGSEFSADDKFAVQIDGKEEVGTYAVQDNNTVKAEAPLYWSDIGKHTVTAWYPAKSGTLDLSDQSQSLAYLLYATGTGDYQTPVTLTFTHQLAKVRVTPSDDALGEVQSLQLYTYTQCTYEKGKAGQGSQEGWIEMKKCEYTENGATITCWEANVVPGYEIKKLRANGTEERNLSSGITPVAGKFYNITLNYDPGYTEVSEGNYTVNNEKGLKNLAELVNNGATDINITLTGDINLTGEWTPIGNYEQKYTGTFDGNGKTITGLTFNQPETNNVGLIGRLGENGIVQDVKLDKVNIKANNNVGGIVGGNNGGSIIGCSVSGDISGVLQVGGVVGYLGIGNNVVTACYHEGSVSGSVSVGGVAGDSDYGSLTACYHVGNVSGLSESGRRDRICAWQSC
ncbi:fimbrillin family protein [Phocaeicola faecicola]|uniref:fimbrillin family protein n=1 Tax=Phocaeicola faecicola TaxID=2739389 RepID=UPI002A81CD4C|nr:fimbrillin family protein [Phocaeicola faecicola]MDY4423780.1 fimbrillin family protein [Bacteroides uniformis]MDY4872163.1 fimbrillin family protein [Phocaeicola faecicola]